MFYPKLIWPYQFIPELQVFFRKNNKYFKFLVYQVKSTYGLHKHRFVTKEKELFGYLFLHSCTYTCCCYDQVFLHFQWFYDNDKYKNFAGRISQDINDYIRLGAFGYYGKEGMNYPNELMMFGGDMTLAYEDKMELNLQYLQRTDDNPSFEMVLPEEVETTGGLAELIFMPDGDRSTVYGTLLYNWIDSDDNTVDYESFTVHAGYLVRTNLRLFAENTYDIYNEENRFVVGFVTGL